MEKFFDIVIVIAPVIGYIPQIYKVIKKGTDEGFNTLRVSFLYNSTILEFYLNLSYNLKNLTLSFHHYARAISLFVAFIGIIFKIIVKTVYSHQPLVMRKHNIINITLFFVYSCIFLPIILLTNTNITLFLSIISSTMNFCNYLPQIYNTYKLKTSGALSYLAVFFDYIGNLGIISYLLLNRNSDINPFLIMFPSIISNISILSQFSLMFYYDYYIPSKQKDYQVMIEMTTISSTSDESSEYIVIEI